MVDLIAGLGTAVRFEDLQSLKVTIDRVDIRLATAETLYEMKKDTLRPIDRADAAALRDRFGLKDHRSCQWRSSVLSRTLADPFGPIAPPLICPAAFGLLCAPSVPRGLRKFRGIEDANVEREAWVTARVRSLREQRGRG